MTKNVLVSISGLHSDGSEQTTENEPIEVITPASYYYKNGKHYILYEEPVEGMAGTVKNTIKITGDEKLEIIKSGLSNTRMIFERDKIHMSQYETPYGQLLLGILTRRMDMDVQENQIEIQINYELDINGEKIADCHIHVNIQGGS